MTNQIKITKENAIASVQNSVSSIFSKEDVLFLINSIQEEQSTPKITFDQLRDLTRSIVNSIEEEAQRDNIVCYEDVEFELNYDRRIEVTDVPINFDAIRDCVEESLTEFFSPEEEEDEEGEEEKEESSF